MTDKIILDIRHSDDYTDYLFQTAALRNRRVIPLVGADPQEILSLRTQTTSVVRCEGVCRDPGGDGKLCAQDMGNGTIRVFTRGYLSDGGTPDPLRAAQARKEVEGILDGILLGPDNQAELFRACFPLLWSERRRICSAPNLYRVPYPKGEGGYPFGAIVRLGTILEIIESDAVHFRYPAPCGCPGGGSLLLVDYRKSFRRMGEWAIHAWCPVCGERWDAAVDDFGQYRTLDRIIEEKCAESLDGPGFSTLTLFDVIDILKQQP